MEAFLTTLPPYVHEFLNKYPPTDVFNLLRELICFAVLYSDDREGIKQSTDEFLKKRETLETLVNDDGVVPELPSERSHDTIKEEDGEEGVEEDKERQFDSLHQQQQQKNNKEMTGKKRATTLLPNTFPDWWGHHEQEELPAQVKKELQISTATDNKSSKQLKQQSVDLKWVSWDMPTNSSVRRERAKSQIIPNLRSYLEEDSSHPTKSIDQHDTTTKSASTVANSKSNRHSMINMRQSASPAALNEEEKPELSKSNSKTKSPSFISKRRSVNGKPSSAGSQGNSTTTTTPTSKLLHQANEQQRREISSKATIADNAPVPSASSSISKAPKRSSSILLKQPRINAAMRARAEHARLQKEEMERKKNQPPPGSSISMRLKQRANSGIDWETIKKERRSTTNK